MTACVNCPHPENFHGWEKEAPRRLKEGEEPPPRKRGKCGARGCPCTRYSSGAEKPAGLHPDLARFRR